MGSDRVVNRVVGRRARPASRDGLEARAQVFQLVRKRRVHDVCTGRTILRLRRMRWAAGVSGMMIAGAGFGAGKNASRNIVAGKSQRSIAALSIGSAPRFGVGTVQAAFNCRRAPSGTIRSVDIVRRAWSDYLTIRYFLAGFLRGVGAVFLLRAAHHDLERAIGQRAAAPSLHPTALASRRRAPHRS
jgi:hypothetical protein